MACTLRKKKEVVWDMTEYDETPGFQTLNNPIQNPKVQRSSQYMTLYQTHHIIIVFRTRDSPRKSHTDWLSAFSM